MVACKADEVSGVRSKHTHYLQMLLLSSKPEARAPAVTPTEGEGGSPNTNKPSNNREGSEHREWLGQAASAASWLQ